MYCNINQKEVLKRKLIGQLLISLAITFAVIFRIAEVESSYYFLLFPVFLFGFINLFQSYFKFCIYFYARGIENKGEEIVKSKSNSRKIYFKYFLKIILLAVIAASIITLLLIVI